MSFNGETNKIIKQIQARAKKYQIDNQPIPWVLNNDEPDDEIVLTLVEEDQENAMDENKSKAVELNEFDLQEEAMLVARITRFHTKNIIKYRVMPVVNGQENFSMRDVYWCITNYFRAFQTRYVVVDEEYPVFLYDNYCSWIKHFGKGACDTYKRNGRYFKVTCPNDPSFEFLTTISQLILFEWLINSLVCEFTSANVELIKKHQRQANEANHQRKIKEGKNFKRQPLTKAPVREVYLSPGQVDLHMEY